MTTENMDIWNSVCKTDPSATKNGKVKGQNITSINGHYVAQELTRQFGPVGIGWGYIIDEDRYDYAGPIADDSGTTLTDGKIHTIKLTLWYEHGGKRGEVSHYGHTPYIYKSRYGFSVDDEAPKKSLTDALKKCASMIGVCADIFLGYFDDVHYRTEQQNRESLEKAEDKLAEKEKQHEEYQTWCNSHLGIIETAASINELEKAYAHVMRRLKIKPDEQFGLKVTRAKDKRKEELSNDKP